ncbi:MAG: OmpA family protein [Alphaproteobacteria bacterium]|nr:OmpA family protein [Alphaproteobacteria bacterium]MBU0797313.1 OmpA family protein [Alphaproteobacteria bacterium]MBU0888899.1 OmpA family protein [Alphaproteobacteria bacterium]MBU1813919.1 OmpA family protein [Alphaproteobacteria bacterium]
MATKARLLAAALVLTMPSLALAQQPGPYIGFGLGGNFLEDSDISGSGVNTDAEFDWGPMGAATLGYSFGGPRLELEFSYRVNDVDKVGGANGGGEARAGALMVNALYDFHFGGFKPYIGVGIGGASVKFDGVGPVAGSSVNDSDIVLAYQGIAGVGYALSPQLDLFADYRYFATEDSSFNGPTGSVDGEYSAHTVMVGVRYFFNGPAKPAAAPVAAPAPQPAPAPVAAPAPPPVPRNYLVFFDFDRSDLTADARQIVKLAADNAKKGGISRLQLVGHADRSGPATYNQRLSLRRAESVKGALVQEGLGQNQIGVEARGESDPLVATADGVREPQNRRVEIILQ